MDKKCIWKGELTMEKFYFEEPSIGRKEDAIAYIN